MLAADLCCKVEEQEGASLNIQEKTGWEWCQSHYNPVQPAWGVEGTGRQAFAELPGSKFSS